MGGQEIEGEKKCIALTTKVTQLCNLVDSQYIYFIYKIKNKKSYRLYTKFKMYSNEAQVRKEKFILLRYFLIKDFILRKLHQLI